MERVGAKRMSVDGTACPAPSGVNNRADGLICARQPAVPEMVPSAGTVIARPTMWGCSGAEEGSAAAS
jgi:hypothetical protein